MTVTSDRPSIIAAKSGLAFYHCSTAEIDVGIDTSRAYSLMTQDPPWPLRMAFSVRDRISALFGVSKIHGFVGNIPSTDPAVGEKLHFFLVEYCSPSKLVLTSRDVHLSVMVCIEIIDNYAGCKTKRLCVTTSVQTHNLFGKIYMMPVGPAHKVILWRLLRRVATFRNDAPNFRRES